MSITYTPASEVEAIARRLIKAHHPHLADDAVRIEYVFRSEHASEGDKTIFGKARKISGLNAYLAANLADEVEDEAGDPFFVIEIAADVWSVLEPSQRQALVDHELSHCLLRVNADGDLVPAIRPHDVEA